ncbi:hypothetical protein B0H13DRAFT_1924891 [Mycena leptocephala]|nr:hypothetical protein B0H13DRAFT_1924891 [Mycena leptocephala]
MFGALVLPVEPMNPWVRLPYFNHSGFETPCDPIATVLNRSYYLASCSRASLYVPRWGEKIGGSCLGGARSTPHSKRQRRVLWALLAVGGVMITREEESILQAKDCERAYLRMNLSNLERKGCDGSANVKAVDDETGMIRAMCGWGKWIRWVQACLGRGRGGSARRKLPPKASPCRSETHRRPQELANDDRKKSKMDLNRARLLEHVHVHSSMAGYPAFRKVGFEDIGRLEVDLDDYVDVVKWVKDRKEKDWGKYTFRYCKAAPPRAKRKKAVKNSFNSVQDSEG